MQQPNIRNSQNELLAPLIKGKPNPKLLSQKIRKCLPQYDFSQPHNLLRDWKTETLGEILEYFKATKGLLTEFIYADIFDLFHAHAFKPLKARVDHGLVIFDLEEDSDVLFLQPDFPHLKLVYEFFVRFLESPECNSQLLGQYINEAFVLQVLRKFDSEDKKERDLLKTILHRIYGKLVPLRSFIRTTAKQKFISVAFEGVRFNGIAELLDMLGSIITGFMSPLKTEHKLFLTQALLPLLKLPTYPQYQSPLFNCLLPFLQKDQETVPIIFRAIIRCFPKTDHRKALTFMYMTEKLLDYVQPNYFALIAKDFAKLLANMISGTQTMLAERSLLLLNVDYVLNLTAHCVRTVIPILFPALYIAASKTKTPWNNKISPLARHYLGTLCTYHNRIFTDAIYSHVIDTAIARQRRQKSEQIWSMISLPTTSSNNNCISSTTVTSMEVDSETTMAPSSQSKEINLYASSSDASEKRSTIVSRCSQEVAAKYSNFFKSLSPQEGAAILTEVDVIHSNLKNWKIVKPEVATTVVDSGSDSYSDSDSDATDSCSTDEEDHYTNRKPLAPGAPTEAENNNNKLGATVSSYSNSSAEMEQTQAKEVSLPLLRPVSLENASKLEVSDDDEVALDTESEDDGFFNSDDDDEFRFDDSDG